MKFILTEGARLPVSVNVAGEELVRAYSTPSEDPEGDILKRARNPKSPMHPCFEWDNEKCGDLYRRQQVRYIIRAVKFVPENDDDEKKLIPVRLISSTVVDDERRYMLTANILSDAEKRELLLHEAMRDMQAFLRKYGALSQLAELNKTMKRVVFEIRTLEKTRAKHAAKMKHRPPTRKGRPPQQPDLS